VGVLKRTQEDLVLAHLKMYGTITGREAYSTYGIMHLPKRINRLKRWDGVFIGSEKIPVKNKFRETVWISQYWLTNMEGERI